MSGHPHILVRWVGCVHRGIVSAAIAGAVALLCQSAMKGAEAPNVLLIVVDDLGWTDLGCYGSSFYDTPELDRFAGTGVRFTSAYSASPVCSPSRAALLTGQDPVRVDITDWIPGHQAPDPLLATPEDRNELGREAVTLGELFQAAGYRTGYIGKWHLGETADYWPESQGFEVNIGGFSKGTPPGGYYSPYNNPKLADGPEGEYLTERLGSEALGFLDADRSRPFFLYLAFYTVHTPIQGSTRWDAFYETKRAALDPAERNVSESEGPLARTSLSQDDAKYAAMVRTMDDQVGRLLHALDSRGLAENTIVVFTSDNGGLSTRRNRGGPTAVTPLRAGKGWLYEGGIRVPLIARVPGVTPAGATSDQVTIGTDLVPTLAEVAGLDLPPDLVLDGQSMRAALSDPSLQEPRAIGWHFPHYHVEGWTPGSAYRHGDWKLIERYEGRTFELYDLKHDIGERNDLFAERPEVAQRLMGDLAAWKRRLGAKEPVAINGEFEK